MGLCAPPPVTLLRFWGVVRYTLFAAKLLACGTKTLRSLTPPWLCCLRSDNVTSVEFADDNTLVSADSGGRTLVWNITTGEEKMEERAGSKFALSKRGGRKQQAGRFECTAVGDLLLICLLAEDEKGGAGGASKGDEAATAARAPVAFFRAPSPIGVLDCRGADIALGLQSGEVLLLRAAVLLT